jgi:ubiquinone/menaquinone biosynthesis C-methylase UbiE
MAFDPVEQSQLYLRHARRLLRSYGAVSVRDDDGELEGERRERFFAKGYTQIANLAAEIETHTGCTLDGRRALDFGCGRGRMSIPLAERCEHVYGLDVVPGVLREADTHAKRMNVGNVEWLPAERLPELSGSYDLVVSFWVFQHIPSREGERLFATILRGLSPGGVGAVHFTLRPSRPVSEPSPDGARGGSAVGSPMLGAKPDWARLYLLMNSYSLNRLGALLADGGVSSWHVNWHTSKAAKGQPYPSAIIIFRKDQ